MCESHGNNGWVISNSWWHEQGLQLNIWQILFQEAEALLEKWKHPDPYRPPTAPGGMSCAGVILISKLTFGKGSKYERNIPAPILDRKFKSNHTLRTSSPQSAPPHMTL